MMNKNAGQNHGLLQIFSKIVDLILLNFVFILCSLPFFTLGASLTALYSVTLKMVKDEEGYIVSDFLEAWMANFRQATLLFIPVVCTVAFFSMDYMILSQYGGLFYSILKALTIIFGVGLLCVFLYIFPVLARFHLSIRQVAANALGMWLFHPFYSLLLILFSAPILFLVFYSLYTAIFLGIIGVVCGCSLYAYIQSIIFRIVFAEFEK